MAQRQYEAFTLFNVRIVDMRHLWSPSDTYKGQKQQKPNYFAGFIVQKTQVQWHLEPALGGLVQALGRLYANNPQIVDWRIEDGDTPNAEGKSSDFAKGHWLFNGSSGNPINTELVQAGGQLVKLANRTGVKPGDYCMVGGTVAVSGQNQRAAKIYLNAVVFSSPGEEIVFANSVSGAQLMEDARKQGLNPVGFQGAGGGFAPPPGGAPFGQPPAGSPFGQPQGGFPQGGGAPFGGSPPNGHLGAFAPMPASGFPNGNPAFGGAPGHGGTPNGGHGNVTFPSNQPQGAFGAAPQNPFAPR